MPDHVLHAALEGRPPPPVPRRRTTIFQTRTSHQRKSQPRDSLAGSFLGLWAASLRLEETGLCRRGLTLTNTLLAHPRITDWFWTGACLLEAGDALVGMVRDVGAIVVYPRQDEVIFTSPGLRVRKCQALEARDDNEGEEHGSH